MRTNALTLSCLILVNQTTVAWTAAGKSPSVGVELDTYQNSGEPVEDHIAVDENGSVAHDGVPAIPIANLEDGREHLLRVAWSPRATRLAVALDGMDELVYTKDVVSEIFGGEPLVYPRLHRWNRRSPQSAIRAQSDAPR